MIENAEPTRDGKDKPRLPNFMALHADRLQTNGYPFLPIKPGDKYPCNFRPSLNAWHGYKDWNKHCDRRTTSFEMGVWKKWDECAVGIACGSIIVALDIDILDEALATEIEAMARRELGDTPLLRIGRAPKRLLVYRAKETFLPIKPHPLEFLAFGSQFVAYGIHPGTKAPYFWPHESPDEVDVSRLPGVTEDMARAFMAKAMRLVPEGMRAESLSNLERGREFFDGGNGRQRGTREAVASAIAHVPNGDRVSYGEWIKMGMALKGALGEEGRALWLDWSAMYSKHVPADTAQAWDSFRPSRIGAGSIYEWAKERGWKPEPGMILDGDEADALNAVRFIPGGNIGDILSPEATVRRGTLRLAGAAENDERPFAEPLLLVTNGVAYDEDGVVLEDEATSGNVSGSSVIPITAPPDISTVSDDPDSIVAEAGGILGEMTDWIIRTARFKQPLLSLGAALACCGALMGHKYRLLDGPDTRTNVMILGLAASGSGKEHPRQRVVDALNKADLLPYFHGRSLASAQGLAANLSGFYSGVSLIDEAGHFFAGMMSERAPTHLREIAALMTELSTSASSMFNDAARAGNKDPDAIRYDIPDPCFCLFATTVPEPLWAAMNSGKANDGFLARFLMFETSLNYPDPSFDAEPPGERIDAVANGLRCLVVGPGVEPTELAVTSALGAMQPLWQDFGNGKRRRMVRKPDVPVVSMTPGAKKEDRRITLEEVARKRAAEGKNAAASIVARTTEHVRRLALIRAVSRDPQDPVVTAEDMRWGLKVVTLSQGKLLPAIEAHVADTPWGATVKKVLDIIRKHGDWMDGKMLARKIYFLKTRERAEVIVQLADSNHIELFKEPTATKTRTLVRAKLG